MKRAFISYILLFFLSFLPISTNADFVANRSINRFEMTREEIIQIFFFFKKFEARQGVKLTVVLPPPNSYLFRTLATNELGVSSSQYLDSIRARVTEGSANPVWAETEAEILIKVSNIPYSIGYYYESVKINDGYGVKTISIK